MNYFLPELYSWLTVMPLVNLVSMQALRTRPVDIHSRSALVVHPNPRHSRRSAFLRPLFLSLHLLLG